jgi:hypothetical protein
MRPMLDQLRERCAELEADNHTLRQRVTKPEGELSERTDTLDAARAVNRELMNDLNRDAPNNLGGFSTVRPDDETSSLTSPLIAPV